MFPPRYRLPIFRNSTEQIRFTFPGNAIANLLLRDETENMDKSRRTKNIRFSWSPHAGIIVCHCLIYIMVMCCTYIFCSKINF